MIFFLFTTDIFRTKTDIPRIFFRYFFPKQQILDSSKLKDFADDNPELDDNGEKLSKKVENTVGKG